jgi:DNA-binding NarL/FixJ family response regulator
VDDHAVFRAGLRALLERQRGLIVVGEAGTGAEAVARAESMRPDVILMDLAMPSQDGIEATRCIVARQIAAKVLVLTAFSRAEELLDALDAGAAGFVEKVSPVKDIVRAIRAVARGERFLGTDAAQIVVLQRYGRETRPPGWSPPQIRLP